MPKGLMFSRMHNRDLITIASVFLISSRTDPSETGTVLAIYSVTLVGLVSVLAAPVSGTLFDTIGTRWLYALSVIGYGIGFLSMWVTRPHPF
jgi:MFS family permease